jgi:hypothetical protein
MTDETREPEELTQEELERQRAEQLPDREVMSVINAEPPLGRIPDETFPPLPPDTA